jgi:serine/threonine-protein kinase
MQTEIGSIERTSASITPSRYQELVPLGEGGMARVSVAEVTGAEGFRRLFVVKRLRPELANNSEIVSQFIDEARLGASLVHSNIIPVFDFGRDGEGYYLAQEYILGRDVDAVVHASKAKRGKPLETSVVLYLAQEALQALSYAHGRHSESGRPLGLVHRDVSPNNLLISARGEVKLLDFGIVKSEQRLTKTQAGVVKGNLYFMSPEQARAREVDARSDLFSLGLVLYAAAVGAPMYKGKTSFELLSRAGIGPTEEDLQRVAALEAPLGGLIARAIAVDPKARFHDADEFARAVAGAAHGAIATSADAQLLMDWLFRDELAAESNRLIRNTVVGLDQ